LKLCLVVVTYINILVKNAPGFLGDCGVRLFITAHIFVLLTLSCNASESSQGTVLVGLWDKLNQTMVLAADSLVRYQGTGITYHRCKILRCGHVGYVGMSGLYTKQAPSFDLERLLMKSCDNATGIRGAADEFLKASRGPFKVVVEYMKVNEAQVYSQWVEKSIEAIFVVNSNRSQQMLARGWRVNEHEILEAVSDEINPTLINLQNSFLSGTNDHILSYVKTHPNWETMGYEHAAKLFVRLESDAHPSTVGGQPSVLILDSRGMARWSERGTCGGLAITGQLRPTVRHVSDYPKPLKTKQK